MVWPLAWCLSLTSLPGVFIGAIVRVEYLPDPAHFKLFAGLVLLYLGLRTTFGLLRKKTESAAEARFQAAVKEAHSHHEKIQTKGSEGDPGSFAVSSASINLKYITYDFYGETFKVSTPGVFTLSFIIGIIGGIYGIGGGAFIAPFMVAFFRLPVYTIAGASLFSAMITTVAGVLFYQIIAPFYPGTSVAPDWLLGLFFGVGGLVGMYLGARCQKFVPANFIKWMLAIVVMYMALSYFKDFFFP